MKVTANFENIGLLYCGFYSKENLSVGTIQKRVYSIVFLLVVDNLNDV